MHRLLDKPEIDSPTIAPLVKHQILHQETAKAGFRNGLGQPFVGIGAVLNFIQPQASHCENYRIEIMLVADRCDVDSRQSSDPSRFRQRKPYRDLAAHAVADHRRGIDTFAIQKPDQIGRKMRIIHLGTVSRGTVIAKVREDDPEIFGQFSREAVPIPSATE